MCYEGEGKPKLAFYSCQLGSAAMIQQALARRPTGPSHQTCQRADDLDIAIPVDHGTLLAGPQVSELSRVMLTTSKLDGLKKAPIYYGARFSLIFSAKDLKSFSDLVIIGKSDSQIVVLGVGSVSRLTIMCQCRCGSVFPNRPWFNLMSGKVLVNAAATRAASSIN